MAFQEVERERPSRRRAAPDRDGLPPELAEALGDLREAREEAREEGFPEPSGVAVENAERLLRAMYEIRPRRYWPSPTPDGEIAIGAQTGFKQSILLICAADGGARCLAAIGDDRRREAYADARALPDAFLRSALDDLGRGSAPEA